MTDLRICDMLRGDDFEGFYILKSAQPRMSTNGKPFLNASIADCTGIIDAKVWDYSGPISSGDEGKIVKIRGSVSEYRGALQVTVDRIRLKKDDDNVDISSLVPVAPIDAERAMGEIEAIVSSIEDEDYRRVCQTLLSRHKEAFMTIPAAKSVHHGFLSGLLMHTLNMLKTADFLSGLYGDAADRSLLLAGTCLHDLGKEREFLFSELGLVTEYSVEGELLGHLVMGAQEIGDACTELGVPEEKAVLLKHLILSHHGEPEFGAAVRPICAEAELLSLIDKIDSRMEIYRENLEGLEVGQFSQRIFALDNKIYRHK